MNARPFTAVLVLLSPAFVRADVIDYSYVRVTDPDADQHVVATQNVRKYVEEFWPLPIYPVTYWGPTANNVVGKLTMRFDAPATITDVRMSALLASFNAGFGSGRSSLFGSKDGTNWQLLLDNPVPTAIDSYMVYDESVPASLTGGTSFWAEVRMEAFNAPNTSFTTAQFSRTTGQNTAPIFRVTLTTREDDTDPAPVPEPAGLAVLALLGGTTFAGRRLWR